MQCVPILVLIKVSGVTNDYSKTANSNVVVITSFQENQGIARELIGINAGIVKTVVENVLTPHQK
jgi:malate dehydrogenase